MLSRAFLAFFIAGLLDLYEASFQVSAYRHQACLRFTRVVAASLDAAAIFYHNRDLPAYVPLGRLRYETRGIWHSTGGLMTRLSKWV